MLSVESTQRALFSRTVDADPKGWAIIGKAGRIILIEDTAN
jgi:hypothetical protein